MGYSVRSVRDTTELNQKRNETRERAGEKTMAMVYVCMTLLKCCGL